MGDRVWDGRVGFVSDRRLPSVRDITSATRSHATLHHDRSTNSTSERALLNIATATSNSLKTCIVVVAMGHGVDTYPYLCLFTLTCPIFRTTENGIQERLSLAATDPCRRRSAAKPYPDVGRAYFNLRCFFPVSGLHVTVGVRSPLPKLEKSSSGCANICI